MDRHLKAIELDKVLLMLSKRACNDDAREIMLSLLPEKSLALAQFKKDRRSISSFGALRRAVVRRS